MFISIWRLQHGKEPQILAEGQIYPESRNQAFFEKPQVLESSTKRLLLGSAFGRVLEAGISDDAKDPGCWPALGLNWDRGFGGTRGQKVSKLSSTSNAPKAGLKIGDIILKVDRLEMPSTEPLNLSEGKAAKLLVQRDGVEFIIEVQPKTFCLED